MSKLAYTHAVYTDFNIDKKFLAFFFRRVKKNSTGRYENDFPYVSPCGPETNYIRCDDLPVVFTHLLDHRGQPIQDIETYGNSSLSQPPHYDQQLQQDGNPSVPDSNFNPLRTTTTTCTNLGHNGDSRQKSNSGSSDKSSSLDVRTAIDPSHHNSDAATHASSLSCTEVLSYGGAGDKLCVPFQPEKLCMLPEGGRVYHAGPDKLEGVGLVKSSLAIELSRFFVYEEGACSESSSPVGFRWRGRTWTIDRSTVKRLRELKMMET